MVGQFLSNPQANFDSTIPATLDKFVAELRILLVKIRLPGEGQGENLNLLTQYLHHLIWHSEFSVPVFIDRLSKREQQQILDLEVDCKRKIILNEEHVNADWVTDRLALFLYDLWFCKRDIRTIKVLDILGFLDLDELVTHEYLAQWLKAYQTIESLDLSGCSLELSELETYLQAINYPRMIELNISGETLDNSCVHALATLLDENARANISILKLDQITPSVASINVDILVDALRNNTKLTSLSISNPEDATVDDSLFIKLIKFLASNSSLLELQLQGSTQFSVMHWIKDLADGVRANAMLQKLEITNIALTGDPIAILADALADQEAMEHLTLSNCRLNDSDCKLLSIRLTRKTNLHSLNLSQNNFTPDAALHIGQLLKENQTLMGIELSDNPALGDQGIGFLVDELIDNETVRLLVLDNTGLSDRGVGILANLLERNPVLEGISLQGNHISTTGASLLLNAIFRNKRSRLNALYLAKNHEIGTEIIGPLINLLRSTTTLEVLDLTSVRLDNASLRELALVLTRQKTLKKLALGVLESPNDIKVLAQALKGNSTLQMLHFGFPISELAAGFLIKALATNITLTELSFPHSNLSEETDTKIKLLLARNQKLQPAMHALNWLMEEGYATCDDDISSQFKRVEEEFGKLTPAQITLIQGSDLYTSYLQAYCTPMPADKRATPSTATKKLAIVSLPLEKQRARRYSLPFQQDGVQLTAESKQSNSRRYSFSHSK